MTVKRQDSFMDAKRKQLANVMREGNGQVWWNQKDGYSVVRLHNSDPNYRRYKVLVDLDQREVEVDAEDLELMNPKEQEFIDDLAGLSFVNEPSLIEVVRKRYGANLIHTFAGRSLLTINPMTRLNIYSSKNREAIRNTHPDELPPHVFSVAQRAYNALMESGRSQTISFIGRSGSGKTYAHHHIVHYLVDTVRHISHRVTHDRVRAARTLVEAFTCSRTLTNTNASRCAELTTLDFDFEYSITGMSVQLFLLERTRIVRRPEGEPTFHVFYHMLAGLDDDSRSKLQILHLDEPNLFMTPLQRQEDRERAAKSWRLIGHAANLLGVSESEWDCVRRLLAAIYHLGVAGAVSSKSGPLNFESCQFEKPGPAQKAAKLLGCPVGELRRYVFDPGMDDVGRRPPTNTAQDFTAEELLEGFVTGLYTEVVLIVSFFINRCLSSSGRSVSTISILDPPGFQNTASCGRNTGATFEDFCFNYAQERLHLLNHDLNFMQKRRQYQEENVDIGNLNIPAPSPSELVDIMDNSPAQANGERKEASQKGLLWAVDEEAVNGSEETFVKRIYQLYHQHRHQVREKSRRVISRVWKNGNFVLNHCLGTQPIQYNPVGWLKNCRDYPTTKNALAMLKMSKSSNLRTLLQECRPESQTSEHEKRSNLTPATRTSGAFMYRQKSVSQQIKLQMDFLVDLLRRSGQVHFIYALVPVPNAGLCDLGVSPMAPSDSNLDLQLLRQQLCGFQILQAILTHQQGYPDQLSFHDFRQQYIGLIPEHLRPESPVPNEKEEVEKMVSYLGLDSSKYKIGLSQVFLRAGVLGDLYERKKQLFDGILIKFQARCRGYLARKKYERALRENAAISIIQYNAELYLNRRRSPWTALFHQLQPVLRAERGKSSNQPHEMLEEIQQLKARCHQLQEEKLQAERACEILQTETETLSSRVTEEKQEVRKAKELLHEAEERRIRTEARLNEAKARLSTAERKVEELEFDLNEARSWQVRASQRLGDGYDDDDDDSFIESEVYRARYERTARELESVRRQMIQQNDDADAEKDKARKESERKIMELLDENTRLNQETAASRRRAAKADAELRSVRGQLEAAETRGAELERKMKRQELETQRTAANLRGETAARERVQREKDDAAAERSRLEKEAVDLRSDKGLLQDKVSRLQSQLDEMSNQVKSGASESELLGLKKAKMELINRIRELEEEVSDQLTEIQALEKANIRLESAVESLKSSHAKELEEREMELENLRLSTQKRLKALESQLQEEGEERQRLLREKREAERQLSEMLSREPQRDREAEKRLKKELKKTKALLSDTQAALEEFRNQPLDKNLINDLKDKLEDMDLQRETALRSKRALEGELEEVQQNLDEVSKMKREAEERCTALQREKTELQLQVEDHEEEEREANKKLKAALAQQQVDQAAMSAQAKELSELSTERDHLKRDLQEAHQNIQFLQTSQVDRSEVVRLENKVRELEAALQMEETSKTRLQANVDRLKEQIDGLQDERVSLSSTEQSEKERARRLTRQLREAKDSLAEAEQRQEEAEKRKNDLANRLEQLQEDYASVQSDLKMALKKITDLQRIIDENSPDDSEVDEDDRTNELINKADAVIRRGSLLLPPAIRRASTPSGRRTSSASIPRGDSSDEEGLSNHRS